MKRLLLIVVIAIIASCEKSIIDPVTLLDDLQDGYWETHGSVLKFDDAIMTAYSAGGWDATQHVNCITQKQEYPYIFLDSAFVSRGDTTPFEIDKNKLIIYFPRLNMPPVEYQRKATLEYKDC